MALRRLLHLRRTSADGTPPALMRRARALPTTFVEIWLDIVRPDRGTPRASRTQCAAGVDDEPVPGRESA